MNTSHLEHRLTELEIQIALQDELVQSLNNTIARMQRDLDLQQAQLRLLYERLQDKSDAGQTYSRSEETPPHY